MAPMVEQKLTEEEEFHAMSYYLEMQRLRSVPRDKASRAWEKLSLVRQRQCYDLAMVEEREQRRSSTNAKACGLPPPQPVPAVACPDKRVRIPLPTPSPKQRRNDVRPPVAPALPNTMATKKRDRDAR
jgi:hypothetical protein